MFWMFNEPPLLAVILQSIPHIHIQLVNLFTANPHLLMFFGCLCVKPYASRKEQSDQGYKYTSMIKVGWNAFFIICGRHNKLCQSQLFSSVVRALVLYWGRPGANPSRGAEIFSAMLRRLVSAFVIRLLESTISKPTSSKISVFLLVSGFESRFVGNLEDRFCRAKAQVRQDIRYDRMRTRLSRILIKFA